MDPKLQKKLEEYSSGFENVLQDKFLKDESPKIDNGEINELEDIGDLKYDIYSGNKRCVMRRHEDMIPSYCYILQQELERLKKEKAKNASCLEPSAKNIESAEKLHKANTSHLESSAKNIDCVSHSAKKGARS